MLTRTDLTTRDDRRDRVMELWRAGLRWRTGFLMFSYCLGILLLLDLMYSNFIYTEPAAIGFRRAPGRIANSEYHHDLAPSFSGYDVWGSRAYRLYTNSLGFKDGSTRTVPLVPAGRRVILIGDSFTEGIGVPFEQTFAGLLYQAGLESAKKVEFLNAGVASYSPVIYYKKIKHLIEKGMRFDEVVVFPDYTDPLDESTGYFCIDDDAGYNAYCDLETRRLATPKRKPRSFLASNFLIADRVRSIVKQAIHDWRHPTNPILYMNSWTLPGFDQPRPPLGLEGGIARALQNMRKLGSLLAAHGISLTVVVYPWPNLLFYDDRDSRHVAIWRAFCVENCRAFINLFPAFFAEKDAHEDWYDRLFIDGDVHFSAGGHSLMFRELAGHLL